MSQDMNFKFLEINIQTINDKIYYPKNYKNEENENQNLKPKITFIFESYFAINFISFSFG